MSIITRLKSQSSTLIVLCLSITLFTCLLIGSGSLFVSAQIKPPPPSSDPSNPDNTNPVIPISDSNFNQLVGEGEWFFFLGAKWCNYCRHMKAEFDLLSDKLSKRKEYSSVVNLGIADIDESPGLASRFLVTFLPSIYHIKDREVRFIDFSSPTITEAKISKRSAQSFIEILDTKLWEKLPIWSAWISPFSIIGRFLGWFGIVVASFHGAFKAIIDTIPFSSEFGVWIGIVSSLVILTLVLFFAPSGKPKSRKAD